MSLQHTAAAKPRSEEYSPFGSSARTLLVASRMISRESSSHFLLPGFSADLISRAGASPPRKTASSGVSSSPRGQELQPILKDLFVVRG